MNYKLKEWISNELSDQKDRAVTDKEKVWKKTIPLVILGSVVGFTALGIIVGYPVLDLLTFRAPHILLGLGFGLFTSVIYVLSLNYTFSPKRLQKVITKSMKQVIETDEEQQRFAAEMLSHQTQFFDFTSDLGAEQIAFGDSYWLWKNNAQYVIVPAKEIEKISYTIQKSAVHTNRVVTYFTLYIIEFTLKKRTGKKKPIKKSFVFHSAKLSQEVLDIVAEKKPDIVIESRNKG